MYTYKVGGQYSPNRSRWPELAQYNFRGGQHELVLFFNQPSRQEIQDVSTGKAEFALYVERSLIILLYQFGQSIHWSDAPYNIHLVPADQRTTAPENETALLHIMLVDASNGIIKAMRVISMPGEFVQALHKAINEQAKLPFKRSDYNGELESLFAGYDSATLAHMAPLHFTVERK
jgi:hypothetical protein